MRFMAPIHNRYAKMLVLTSEGQIHVININSMHTEVILPTYNLAAGGDPLKQVTLANDSPKFIDISTENYAMIFTQIQEQEQ